MKRRALVECGGAAIVLAIATGLFNLHTVTHLNEPKSIQKDIETRYADVLQANETAEFTRLLSIAAENLQQGRLFVPISSYDCPISYLTFGGLTKLSVGCTALEAHNVFYLIVFFLNGFFAFIFLRSQLDSPLLALLGSLMYQSSNYVFMSHFMGHMHNVQIEWLPLIFLAVNRLMQPGTSVGWTILLGVGMGMQVLSSPYYVMYMSFAALPVYTLTIMTITKRSGCLPARTVVGFAGKIMLAAALAVAISAFYLIPRMRTPSQVFAPPVWRAFVLDHYLELLDPGDPVLFIGLPLFGLTILSLRWWYYNRECSTTAVVATMAVMLAMMLPAVPGAPRWWFHVLVPKAHFLRVATRCFPMFHLMLIALAGKYLCACLQQASRLRRSVVIAGAASLFAAFTWLPSPWVVGFDLAGTAKRIVGQR